ncbi:MAG: type III pantothenate kinase, partial [Bacteroidota bacterium]
MALYLSIDIGNTRAKLGLFDEAGEMCREVAVFETQEGEKAWLDFLHKIPTDQKLHIGWLSTGNAPAYIQSSPIWRRFSYKPHFLPITSQTELPIGNDYATPKTLGMDRIISVVAACNQSPGVPVLVVDAGTAITYDFADEAGRYKGGAISPGIRMRLQALHTFTAKLPLESPELETPWLGDSTRTSILSGVIHGARAEVEGKIMGYK